MCHTLLYLVLFLVPTVALVTGVCSTCKVVQQYWYHMSYSVVPGTIFSTNSSFSAQECRPSFSIRQLIENGVLCSREMDVQPLGLESIVERSVLANCKEC